MIHRVLALGCALIGILASSFVPSSFVPSGRAFARSTKPPAAKPAANSLEPGTTAPAAPAGATPSIRDPASTCEARLARNAKFKPIGELNGSIAGCGGKDVVLLSRIRLEGDQEVALEPAATMRCEMAEAVVGLVRDELAPAAASMGSPLSALENYDSYDCRSRNRIPGSKLSEHGLANALDIRSVRLRDGRVVRPAETAAPRAFREAMRAAACERFSTVLGPGSDGYHEDHIHIDRRERASRYRTCHWDVHDAPRIALQSVSAGTAPDRRSAVPLPRVRPPLGGAAPAHPAN